MNNQEESYSGMIATVALAVVCFVAVMALAHVAVPSCQPQHTESAP